MRSCGCMGDIEETKHTKLTWVINNGQNLRSDNTSGIRDVLRANGKQGSKNYLSKENILAGTFDEKKDAVAARKEAEYHLYRDFLKWYNCKYDK